MLVVRNEVDILRLCVVHHLATACDRILVLDNGSTDGSQKALKRLAKRLPIDWTVDAGPFSQHELVTGLAEEARSGGADWVLPLDADEFWFGQTDLRNQLPRYGDVGAVKVRRVEFIQKRSQLRSTARGILEMTMRVERATEGPEVIGRFRAREASVFEMQPAPKLAMRATKGLAIRRGGHHADGLAGATVDATDLTIFHAPLRSKADIDRKAAHGQRLIEAGVGASEGLQSQFFREEVEAGRGDEAWSASSAADGVLDVYGRQVELIKDDRLSGVLGPWVRGPAGQMAARLLGRSY